MTVRRVAQLAFALLMVLSSVLVACQPEAETVEIEVTRQVEVVVTEIVEETVYVDGTPQVIETEVTRVVEVTPEPPPAEPQKPVIILQAGEPPTLDPPFHESGTAANVHRQMFDFLLGYNRDMEVVGCLAESWELMPDEVTWQFKLHEGVEFWNGEPLDAEAVKFTFDRIGDEALREQGLTDRFYARTGLKEVNVVDEYTVNFVLEEPKVLFEMYATYIPILAPIYYSEHSVAETALAPMGSGPWMFQEWVKDDHLTMVANPNYWMGMPEIETLIFKPVPEASVRMAMLEVGEADIIANLSPEDAGRVDYHPDLDVRTAIGGRRVHISIPTGEPIFSDRRVRQAMNYAVDMDTINEALLGGLARGRMEVPVNGEFWIDPSIEPYPYDPDKARALLEEAGWDPATEVTLFTAGRTMKGKDLCQAVAANLQDVGMNAHV